MSSNSPLRYVDSHCHLNFNEYDLDRDLVVSNARQNGVAQIVIPGVDIETSQSALQFAKEYHGVYAAVGVHPNSGLSWTDSSLQELKRMAADRNVVAIGEIGLDYYRDFCPRNQQLEILDCQLDLATELALPVIVHFRQSAEDITQVLSNWHSMLKERMIPLAERPGVFHAFSGDLTMAQLLIDHKFKLGIGGPVTFHNSQTLQDIVASLPLQSFLIETDSPYLSPHPLRGKRNEPTNVRIVAEKIAELRAIPVEQVAEVTTNEARMLFGWGGSH